MIRRLRKKVFVSGINIMSQGPKWQHKTTNGKYFISTSDVIFSGWETMVFRIIHDEIEYNELDYNELDFDRYNGEDEAYWGHIKMFQKWDEKE